MEILSELEVNLPGLAMVAVRRIGVERRRGNREAAMALFSRLIDEADSAEVRSFYTIKYSRYQAKVWKLGDEGGLQSFYMCVLEDFCDFMQP